MDKSLKKGKMKKKEKEKLQHLPSYVDDMEMLSDQDVGKDFGTLMNAPLSKSGHFVFKSEKAWSVDSSQYSEFFTLNLKTLSAAINCIPLNEYINVNTRYFISDQLTNINNDAEKGKVAYNTYLNDLNTQCLSDICSKNETKEDERLRQLENLKSIANTDESPSKNCVDNLEEDIDFLLSLKEPVQSNSTIAHLVSTSHNNDSKAKVKNTSIKPIDLEKWLDTVLDD